ncbi:myelin-oligodendrocyte glycoprotein-like isoform X2 [Numida meleagris]|uniref:myelin-oligodendrocyte glycoprotein-like isoform X2 n=1 Tax=Numida meleagris TaxID=8996 RepID=UPI000B3DADEE|nr:myelin-oligodendrocyte glycoprotein-like isoform X2 [Numida meleagris]
MRFGLGCNHPRSALPWRSLLPHLLALLLLHLGSAQLRVVAPSPRVTAIVGQDVVLRCHLSPFKDARSLDIRWIQQRSAGLVHHYQDGVDLEQMEEYKGRTELLRNGLSDGNLDLRITAVSSSDSGSYICAVQDGADYAEAVVNLEVSDPCSQIVHSWAAALAVVFPFLLGSFVIIVFLHWKRVAQSRELTRKDAQLVKQAAILEKQAAELVKLTEEVEIWSLWLNEHFHCMDSTAADLKKQAEKLVKYCEKMERRDAIMEIYIRELEEQSKAVEKWNSVLKTRFQYIDYHFANLKKYVAKLAEQSEAGVVKMEESEETSAE